MTTPIILAQLDSFDLPSLAMLGVKVFLAIAAGFAGFYLSTPLIALLYRLAFQKPAPQSVKVPGRLVCAMILGILAFFYIPLGSGGFGWGGGSGSGGPGDGGGQVANGKDTEKKDQNKGTGKNEKKKGETLAIEMMVSEVYQKNYRDTGKYYLIQGEKEPRTLEEIKALLTRNKNKWSQLEIIIYANSMASSHPAVLALEQTAEQFQLDVTRPTEYHNKIKTQPSAQG